MFDDLKDPFKSEKNPFGIKEDLDLENPFGEKNEEKKDNISIPVLDKDFDLIKNSPFKEDKKIEKMNLIEKRLTKVMEELNQIFSDFKELKEEIK